MKDTCTIVGVTEKVKVVHLSGAFHESTLEILLSYSFSCIGSIGLIILNKHLAKCCPATTLLEGRK